MYTAIPRQLSARITCCSFPAPISLSPRRHTNQARGAHTAPLSPPSTASERCFRFPVARAFPPRPRALHSRTAEPNTHPAAVAPCDPCRSSRAGPTRRNPGTDPESPEPTAAGAAPAREPLFPAPPRPARALRWARAEPRPLPPRSATHRRPCGSAPPRLRPARTARGRGKGASPREERLGVGNMAASSRAQVLRLYRALLRESQRFSCYGYRCGEGLRGWRTRGSPPRRGVPAVLGAGARGAAASGGAEPCPGATAGPAPSLGPAPGLGLTRSAGNGQPPASRVPQKHQGMGY